MIAATSSPKKQIVVMKDEECITKLLADIAFFFSTGQQTFAVDKDGEEYLVDLSLPALMLQLDTDYFFRINKDHVVNIDFVISYAYVKGGAMRVHLSKRIRRYSLFIDEDVARAFRKWISEC